MTDQTTPATELSAEEKAAQLKLLKSRADLMGIAYSNNIGLDALRDKIAAKVAGENAVNVTESNAAMDLGSTPDQVGALGASEEHLTPNQRLWREQMALVRCRITNLDPKKRDLPGEIFAVANRVLGTVRKFIPYGELTENGYHIPRILFNELNARKFNHISTRRDPHTKTEIVESRWVKEFSLEILPPLTQDELRELATAQIAAGSVPVTGELS
jgi:hypothetical protein